MARQTPLWQKGNLDYRDVPTKIGNHRPRAPRATYDEATLKGYLVLAGFVMAIILACMWFFR